MKKRSIIAFLLILALALTLAACSSTQQPALSESPAQTSQGAEAQSPEPTPNQNVDTPAASAENPPEDAAKKSISYPIQGEYTLHMLNVYNPNFSAVYGDGDLSDALTYQALAEATGVNVTFTMLPEATHATLIDLTIASGDLPDLFGRTLGTLDSNLLKAIEDDIVIDIAPLVEENAPDWYAVLQSDETYKNNMYNLDGSLCRVAGRSQALTTLGLMIRQDWLEELGLKKPTTTDELTDVLRAFKTEYDTTMTLLVNYELDDGLDAAFNSAAMGFRQMMWQMTTPDSGQVVAAFASEGYIDHLRYLAGLFSEGIINDDFLGISKENNNVEPHYLGGKSGVWNDDPKNAVAASFSEEGWSASPLSINRSTSHMVQKYEGGTVSMVVAYISGKCEIPEIALQLMNYGFTEEGKDFVGMGERGLTYDIGSDGKPYFTDLIINNPDGWTVEQAKTLSLTDAWMPTDQQMKVIEMSVPSYALEAYDMWTNDPAGDGLMIFPTDVKLTVDEYEEVMQYQADVQSLFNEAAAKFVVGQSDEAGYRNAIDVAYSTGLSRMTEIYQFAYERYLRGEVVENPAQTGGGPGSPPPGGPPPEGPPAE